MHIKAFFFLMIFIAGTTPSFGENMDIDKIIQTKEILAVSTPLQQEDGGTIRIRMVKFVNHNNPDSPILGFIEIQLKDGWKTYWRNPGGAGFAPSFTFNQKANARISYPAPHYLGHESDWAIGYQGSVILPFTIDTASHDISGQLTIGLCEKICIPATVPFSFKVSDASHTLDVRTQMILSASLINLPAQPNDDFKITDIHIDNNHLVATLIHPAQKTSEKMPQLFMDGGDLQIGPANVQQHSEKQTRFIAPLLSKINTKKTSVAYTAVLDNSNAISGYTNLQKK